MTLYPFSCLDTNFRLDILKNMDFKAWGWFLISPGATPGGLKLPLRAFEPQMSPPYDATVIQMLSFLLSTFILKNNVFLA